MLPADAQTNGLIVSSSVNDLETCEDVIARLGDLDSVYPEDGSHPPSQYDGDDVQSASTTFFPGAEQLQQSGRPGHDDPRVERRRTPQPPSDPDPAVELRHHHGTDFERAQPIWARRR
ncbi:MAG: hypothetical protein U0798_19545 [Gemmataceae bacterium]